MERRAAPPGFRVHQVFPRILSRASRPCAGRQCEGRFCSAERCHCGIVLVCRWAANPPRCTDRRSPGPPENCGEGWKLEESEQRCRVGCLAPTVAPLASDDTATSFPGGSNSTCYSVGASECLSFTCHLGGWGGFNRYPGMWRSSCQRDFAANCVNGVWWSPGGVLAARGGEGPQAGRSRRQKGAGNEVLLFVVPAAGTENFQAYPLEFLNFFLCFGRLPGARRKLH